MDKLKVAMIGLGHAHADGVMTELVKQSDVFDTYYYDDNKAVLDGKNYSGATKIESEEKLKSLLPDLKGIIIEASMDKILDTANKYKDLKLPMHIDKPITDNYGAFAALMDYAGENAFPIQMGYMYRYNDMVKECVKMLNGTSERKLGELYEVNAVMNTELGEESRRALDDKTGGVMYPYGCHMVDLLVKFMGEPEEIHPYLSRTGFGGAPKYDCAMAVYKYKNGTSFVRTTAVEVNGYARRQLVLCGSQGTAVIEPLEMTDKTDSILEKAKLIYTEKNSGNNVYKDNSTEVEFTEKKRRYQDMLADYARMIRNETPDFPFDAEYEKTVHRVFLKSCGINI